MPNNMMQLALVVIAVQLGGALAAESATDSHGFTMTDVASWQAHAAREQGLLTGEALDVFIVAHTHDDTGWLKTVDDYYTSEVKSILDTVTKALQVDAASKRIFSYVEIAFFERWWKTQSNATRAVTRQLVKEGRLEFNLAGWCMNDDAGPTYNAAIDQMTEGAQFVLREFGVEARATVGWHIDPFGHSASVASMWSGMGFDAYGLNRIDYRQKAARKLDQGLEFVWRGSSSLGEETQIFAHVLDSHYGTPHEMSYDKGTLPKPNPLNIKSQADAFVAMARTRSAWYRHQYLLLPYGDDFDHQDATRDYDDMDKLMARVNGDTRYNVTVRYGGLADYVKAVNSLGLEWALLDVNHTLANGNRDFMPYATDPHNYWSGYYSSRPKLKGYARSRSNLLRHAELLMSTFAADADAGNSSARGEALGGVTALRRAVGVTQHHDAITGTEKQDVSDNYMDMMASATVAVGDATASVTAQMLATGPDKWGAAAFTIDPGIVSQLGAPSPCGGGGGAAGKRLNCTSWRQTADCDATGTKREPKNDKGCAAPIKDGTSGYCECAGGVRRALVGCHGTRPNGALPFTCDQVCHGPAVPLGCTSWRQTADCDGHGGHREPKNDKTCASSISLGDSGFCECTGGVKREMVDCLHHPHGRFTCTEACAGFPQHAPRCFGLQKKPPPFNVSAVLLHNTLGWGVTHTARLVVNRSDLVVRDDQGELLPSQINPLPAYAPQAAHQPGQGSGSGGVRYFDERTNSMDMKGSDGAPLSFALYFTATLPPASMSTFFVSVEADNAVLGVRAVAADNVVQNDAYELQFQLGLLSSVTNKRSGITSAVKQNLLQYESSTGDGKSKQSSGAYIFRPKPGAPAPVNLLKHPSTAVYSGPVLVELQQTFRAGYAQTWRLYNSTDSQQGAVVEVVVEAGTLDNGHELITRFDTDLATLDADKNPVCSVDDNGLEQVKRTTANNPDEPVAANYYPMAQTASITDTDTGAGGRQWTVISDRAHGAASLAGGALEVMMHRRCSKDDGKGVGETLSVEDHISAALWLTLDTTAGTAAGRHRAELALNFPPTMVFSPAVSAAAHKAAYQTSVSKLLAPGYALPPNVHLLSFDQRYGVQNATVLRLQHMYEKGEHATLSQPVTIDLAKALGPAFSTGLTVTEMSTSANLPKADMLARKLQWKVAGEDSSARVAAALDGAATLVTLNPRQIKTFLVNAQPMKA